MQRLVRFTTTQLECNRSDANYIAFPDLVPVFAGACQAKSVKENTTSKPAPAAGAIVKYRDNVVVSLQIDMSAGHDAAFGGIGAHSTEPNVATAAAPN